MLPKVTLRVLIVFTILVWQGCNRSSDDLRTVACFTTQHHDQVLPNIDVLVKFNTDIFPGYLSENEFDLKLVSDVNGRVCFRDFPLGNHWFVGIGFDEQIKEVVYGNNNYRFDLSNLKVDDILYVGEE